MALIMLLLDRMKGRSYGSKRCRRVGILFGWLMSNTFAQRAVEALSWLLRSHTTSPDSAFAVCCALRSATWTDSSVCKMSPAVSVTLTRALRSAARAHSMVAEKPAPTNLMVAILDASICCISYICSRFVDADHGAKPLWRNAFHLCSSHAVELINRLQQWRGVSHSAFIAATDELIFALSENDPSSPSPPLVGFDAVSEEIRKACVHEERADELERSSLWTHCAPFLLCDCRTPTAQSLHADVERLIAQATKESADSSCTDCDGCSNTYALSALCCLALLLDSLPAREREEMVTQAASRLRPLVATAMCGPCARAAVPLALLVAFLPAWVDPAAENATVILQPLLDLLSATDAAPSTVVSLIAGLTVKHPTVVLSDVVSLLDSPVSNQRANAVAIISKVSERCALLSVLGRKGCQRVTRSLISRMLAESSHAVVWQQSIDILCRVDLQIVLPLLLASEVAAGMSEHDLETVFGTILHGSHAAPSLIAASCIDALRAHTLPGVTQPSHEVPSNPGQIGPKREAFGADMARGEQSTSRDAGIEDIPGGQLLLRALEEWASRLDVHHWPAIIRTAGSKFFGASQDVFSLQVVKHLLARSDAAVTQALVAEAAVDRFNTLTVSGVQLDQHPYDHLRPMLLLQMLPEKGWLDQENCAVFRHACERTLMDLMNNDRCIQPVRKLAVSLLARMPSDSIAAMMLSHLSALASEPHGGSLRPLSGLSIYYFCSAAMLHPKITDMMVQNATLLFDLLAAKPGSGELERMQRGAMECLARVLSVECIDSLDVSGSALAPRILDMLRQGGVTTLHALIILRLAAHAQQARLGSVPLRDLVLPELRRLCESTDPTGNIRLLLQELEGGILG